MYGQNLVLMISDSCAAASDTLSLEFPFPTMSKNHMEQCDQTTSTFSWVSQQLAQSVLPPNQSMWPQGEIGRWDPRYQTRGLTISPVFPTP